MRVALIGLLLVSTTMAGCLEGIWDDPEPDAEALALLQELATFPEWRMETDHGTIRSILYTGWLPTTTAHIAQITERGHYTNTTMHRIVDEFVIQGGDPTGTGEGGSGPMGTSDDIPLEIKDGLDFGTGAIGLARWTDDTGDSQFFFMEKPAIHLSQPSGPTGEVFGAYSLFGQVFEGQDVIRDMADVPVDANDKPLMDVKVYSASMAPPPTDADLISLIPNLYPGVSTQGYGGDLEIPRIALTDYSLTIRFTSESIPDRPEAVTPMTPLERVPCNIQSFGLVFPDGTLEYHDWTANSLDGCTFESRLMFDEPGTYEVDLGVESIAFEVLPWHDAYAPFTGTPKADS